MKAHNHVHLQEEKILWAVIDEKELGGEEQQHLRECQHCRGKVEQIQADLQDFGQKARQAVPPFSRPVTLPVEKSAAASHGPGWLPFFAAAAMAGFVVFFYFMGMKPMEPPPAGLVTVQSQESLLEDETLMRQISELVEDPLYEDMYEITGENGTDIDEEFLQFIMPYIQDDFQSELFI
jgi:hypothetical protein